MRVKSLAQEHNTMTRPGLKPGPLDPESSALTTRPPRLPESALKWDVFLSLSNVHFTDGSIILKGVKIVKSGPDKYLKRKQPSKEIFVFCLSPEFVF